jgi:hypothetical protein
MNRAEIVAALCEADLEFILNNPGAGAEMLYAYLETGFPGYENFTDAELLREMRLRDDISPVGEPHV